MSFRGRRFNQGKFTKNNRNFKPGNKNHTHFNVTYEKRDKPNVDQPSLSESDLGITEYTTKTVGFTGVIKARFSDFHVNEIALDGTEAKLTSLDVPDEPVQTFEDDESLVGRYCNDHLPVDVWDKLNGLVQSKDGDPVEMNVDGKTKEERTKIHDAVKSVFGNKIVANTHCRDGIKYITFKKYNPNQRVDTREAWPRHRAGDYVHFVTYKEQCDTLEAAMRVADALRIKPNMITYAGTKDRRAKTSQWLCVKKIDPRAIKRACAHIRNVHVGNYTYKTDALKLGALIGNRFRICLRNVRAPDDVIRDAIEALDANGFLNYYGHQRFGNNANAPTFVIGKHLLLGEWRDVVDLILTERTGDDPAIAEGKRAYLETRTVPDALVKVLTRKHAHSIEAKLLAGLANAHENDLVNALEAIPRNMRLLYLHGYQSHVWNRILSRRVKEFGLNVIVGDLVMHGDVVILDGDEEDAEPSKNVKILNETDLETYTIKDVVLPLPGCDIVYPDNVMKQWYQELLEADGLTLQMDQMRVKKYKVGGTYRKCVCAVENLTWYIQYYDDPNATMIRSDLEELHGTNEVVKMDTGKFKAVVLDFKLVSCAYATMALREVMKCDTSSAAHSKLNDYKEEGRGESSIDQREVDIVKRKLEELGEADVKKIKCE